jgi:anthranilate phosphoribosyltransferase
VADGVRVAQEAIDTGAARRTLEQYVELSQTA